MQLFGLVAGSEQAAQKSVKVCTKGHALICGSKIEKATRTYRVDRWELRRPGSGPRPKFHGLVPGVNFHHDCTDAMPDAQ